MIKALLVKQGKLKKHICTVHRCKLAREPCCEIDLTSFHLKIILVQKIFLTYMFINFLDGPKADENSTEGIANRSCTRLFHTLFTYFIRPLHDMIICLKYKFK